MVNKPLLTLYVSGRTSRSERAIAHMRGICAQELADRCELTVIDVLEHPQLADEAKILATPTLIKATPAPVRRIVGDLSDGDKVLLELGLMR